MTHRPSTRRRYNPSPQQRATNRLDAADEHQHALHDAARVRRAKPEARRKRFVLVEPA